MYFLLFLLLAAACAVFYKGIIIVRPIQRGLIETFGRYSGYMEPGFRWRIPFVQKLYTVNISEQLLNLNPQLVCTSDGVNVIIDAQVYIKVRPDAESVKSAIYKTDDYTGHTTNLARTTLGDIISTMPFCSLNTDRARISEALFQRLVLYTAPWGVEIIRTELKEIETPRDIQEALNNRVKAEYEKSAAVHFAAAAKTAAEGVKCAEIEKAEGLKQAKIVAAEGQAAAIRLICGAAQQYSSGEAQLLSILEASETAQNTVTNENMTNEPARVEIMDNLSRISPGEKKEQTGRKYKRNH